jgi:hypothetical protein
MRLESIHYYFTGLTFKKYTQTHGLLHRHHLIIIIKITFHIISRTITETRLLCLRPYINTSTAFEHRGIENTIIMAIYDLLFFLFRSFILGVRCRRRHHRRFFLTFRKANGDASCRCPR